MLHNYWLIDFYGSRIDLNNPEIYLLEADGQIEILIKCDIVDAEFKDLIAGKEYRYCSPVRSAISVRCLNLSFKQEYLFKHCEIHLKSL